MLRQLKVKDVANLISGEVVGDGDVLIGGINGIKEAKEGELAFILKAEFEALIDQSRASCVIVPKSVNGAYNKAVIKTDNPSIALSKAIEVLLPGRLPHPKGIDKLAVISKSASLGSNVACGPYVVVEDGVVLGDNTVVYPFSYIGTNSTIGNDCVIFSNVTIREEVTIGNRVIVHSGTVIGSDGFGYDTQKNGAHVKIPQLGKVVIEDDVELGACVTIDRARFSNTLISKGTKIDNLCQIAHNVVIGPNGLIAAQTGIAGSTVIGRNVVFGGQCGVADHVNVGDFVIAAAKTGITKSIPPKTVLFGFPAKSVDKAKEIVASLGLLPKLFVRVKALEEKIKELDK